MRGILVLEMFSTKYTIFEAYLYILNAKSLIRNGMKNYNMLWIWNWKLEYFETNFQNFEFQSRQPDSLVRPENAAT